MNTKITIRFGDGTNTEIHTSKLKSVSVSGATLEIVRFPTTDYLLSAYFKYVYKYPIMGVELNYDE